MSSTRGCQCGHEAQRSGWTPIRLCACSESARQHQRAPSSQSGTPDTIWRSAHVQFKYVRVITDWLCGTMLMMVPAESETLCNSLSAPSPLIGIARLSLSRGAPRSRRANRAAELQVGWHQPAQLEHLARGSRLQHALDLAHERLGVGEHLADLGLGEHRPCEIVGVPSLAQRSRTPRGPAARPA
jgi:hypothetical protein